MSTFIWQEKNTGKAFRIQTDEIEIHRKILERKEFKLVGEGINVPLWVYRAEFPSLESARRTIHIIIESED